MDIPCHKCGEPSTTSTLKYLVRLRPVQSPDGLWHDVFDTGVLTTVHSCSEHPHQTEVLDSREYKEWEREQKAKRPQLCCHEGCTSLATRLLLTPSEPETVMCEAHYGEYTLPGTEVQSYGGGLERERQIRELERSAILSAMASLLSHEAMRHRDGHLEVLDGGSWVILPPFNRVSVHGQTKEHRSQQRFLANLVKHLKHRSAYGWVGEGVPTNPEGLPAQGSGRYLTAEQLKLLWSSKPVAEQDRDEYRKLINNYAWTVTGGQDSLSVANLLGKPNDEYSWNDILVQIFNQVRQSDVAFLWVVPDKQGKPFEIHCLSTVDVKPTSYGYAVNGAQVPAEQVVSLKSCAPHEVAKSLTAFFSARGPTVEVRAVSKDGAGFRCPQIEWCSTPTEPSEEHLPAKQAEHVEPTKIKFREFL